MGDLAEKRVHDKRATRQLVFAATGRGVAVVETAGDSIGRVRLAHECEARDLAGGGGWVAVATPEDVLTCEVDADDEGDAVGAGEWIETGFGPAVAVGVDQGDLLAAGPDGELGRVVDVATGPTDWLAVADVDGTVRAIDGPLVGASDGVYRFTPDGLFDVGLDDVRDVSAAGVPLAATGQGLFRLGNGWLRELDGPVDVVAGTDRPGWDGESTRGGTANDGPTDDSPDDDGPTDDSPTDAEQESSGDPLVRGHAAASDQLYEYSSARTRERSREAGGETGTDADRQTGDGVERQTDDGVERQTDDDAGHGTGEVTDPGSKTASGGREVEEEPVATTGESDGFEDEIVSPAVAAQAWRERSTPIGPVVAVAHGQRTYALSADGTFLLDRGEEWATRATGLPDVVALATPE